MSCRVMNSSLQKQLAHGHDKRSRATHTEGWNTYTCTMDVMEKGSCGLSPSKQ